MVAIPTHRARLRAFVGLYAALSAAHTTDERHPMSEIEIRQPRGYSWLADEPTFDPVEHLALCPPERQWSLEDFAYPEEIRRASPFQMAVTSPFRMLSEAGVTAARAAIEALEAEARSCDRIAKYLRGTVYRSRFIRDLCNSPDVTRFIAGLVGVAVAPHTMPLYQGHVNLKPEQVGRDVDRWHVDTVALDFVLLLSDPDKFRGGEFEYFHGPKQEAERVLRGLPAVDVPRVSVRLPGPGWALAQQGNMVVHRAKAVTAGGDRTTLVNSYIPLAPSFRDVSRLNDCKPVDPAEVLMTEWARHKAFLAKTKLEYLIDNLPFGADPHSICEHLEEAIGEVRTGVEEIRDRGAGALEFFGGDGLTGKV